MNEGTETALSSESTSDTNEVKNLMGGEMRQQEEVRWVMSELEEEAGDQEQSVYLGASSADSSVSDQLSKSVCLQLKQLTEGEKCNKTAQKQQKNTKLDTKRASFYAV